MTEKQWNSFCTYKDELKKLCGQWLSHSRELKKLQKEAAALKGGDDSYPFETPVVYNSDYDSFTRDDEINLFVIGDNPGKEEQLEKNQRYLCGQSGRLARGFFERNPELKTDFARNVIIMNKTPVHTAKTTQLSYLMKNGSSAIKEMIVNSQLIMARLASRLHREFVENCPTGKFVPELWLVGYSELKPKKLFGGYRDALKAEYEAAGKAGLEAWNKVFVYQHFSMNRFTIDLKEYGNNHPENTLKENLENLGHLHRDEIFK